MNEQIGLTKPVPRLSVSICEDLQPERMIDNKSRRSSSRDSVSSDKNSLHGFSFIDDSKGDHAGVPMLSVHSNQPRKNDRFKYKIHELSAEDLLKNIKHREEETSLVVVHEKNPYEQAQEIEDSFPLLQFRKALLLIIFSVQEGCRLIVTCFIFDYFIVAVILFNTVIIALDSTFTYDFSVYELTFIIIYTCECILKIIGLGLISNKNSYLRDYWNYLDFSILIISWISEFNRNVFNLTDVRTLRILRIFRSISSIGGLKIIFLALLGSASKLTSSLILLFLWCFVFAVAGVQLFMGVLSKQCMNLDTGYINGEICGSKSCPNSEVCVSSLLNPYYGNLNFDNTAYSMLAVFQSITLEGWSEILHQTSDSFGNYSILFFIPMTFIGAFILIDLALAIIKTNFTKTMNKLKRRPQETWTEDKMLKDFAKKRQDGFVEIDLSEQSMYFGNIRRMQQLMSLAPEQDSFVASKSSNGDQNSSDSEESAKNGTEIIEKKRISILNKVNHIAEELEETYIQDDPSKRRSSLRSRRESGCEIKTVIKIKLKLLEKFRNGKYHKHFKIEVVNDYKLNMESSQDINDAKKVELAKVFYYTGYGFNYFTETINVYDRILHENQEYLKEKYRLDGFELFLALEKIKGGSFAFFELMPSVKNYIMEEENKFRTCQKVNGEWSGSDVKRFRNFDISTLNFENYRYWATGFQGYYQKVTYPILIVINAPSFNRAMIFVVIINTIVLSIDHYRISDSYLSILNTCNFCLTIIFSIEIFFKILGLGLVKFVRDSLNIFDFVVVVLSVIELVFINGSNSRISAFRSVRVFRIFRVLRIAKIFRYVQSFFHILKAVGSSLSKFIYLFLLLLLFIVIFSLLGVQIFSGKFFFSDGMPRSNFEGFGNAFITVWQLLTMNKWFIVLYNAMRSEVGKFSAFYFIIWIILGNFILLNLFLAILLDSFTEDAEKIIKHEKKNYSRQSVIIQEIQSSEEFVNETLEIERKRLKYRETSFKNIECIRSYFLFSKSSFIRKFCYRLYSSELFENVIFMIIILSSIKLVWDTYIINYSANSIEQVVSFYIDLVLVIIFCLEFVIKSISMGLILDSGSYLRDNWNKIDFTIMLLSILDNSISSFNISSIKVLRLLRTLRPLRLLSHNISMKIVVTAILESLISICNVVVVLLIFSLIFAILGVSLFGGMLYTCENPVLTTEVLCLDSGYQWLNSEFNFDNVFEASITLFILSTEDGWTDIMHKCMDTVAPGMAPSTNANFYAAYYFIIYILFDSFFLLNLFIAVIFEKFTEAKIRESSLIAQGLTKDQQLWVEMQRLAIESKPNIEVLKPPQNAVQNLLFRVSVSKIFHWIVTIFIIFNLFEMAIYYNGASSEYISCLKYIGYFINSVFIIEALVKIIGNGFSMYIKSNWNKFDFVTVLMSIVGMITENIAGLNTSSVTITSQIIRIIRVVRIIRVLRVIRFLASIEEILTIISYSLPAILNVLSLLILVYFIYSILGVFAFSSVNKGEIIDDYYNFSNFHSAMIMMYRISTGEEWYLIMFDCSKVVGRGISLAFFCSFIVVTTFLLLNLFIMVILQNYEEFEANPNSSLTLFNKHIKEFRKIWEIYSFNYHGILIHHSDISNFCYELGNELGFDRTVPREKILKIMLALRLNIDNNGYVYYNDMLYVLLKKLYKTKFTVNDDSKTLIELEERHSFKKLAEIQKKWRKKFLNQEKQIEFKGANLFFGMMYSKIVFKSWKNYVKKKKNREIEYSENEYSENEYPGENSLDISENTVINNFY